MRRARLVWLLALSGLVVGTAASRQPDLFLSYRAEIDPDLTADPDSPFWIGIPGVFIEQSILGGPVPELRSEVRSRWTESHIYFLFIGPYRSLTLKPDPDTVSETYRLWEWDCFEVYLGANFSDINRYREFQMSPQGEFLDLDIDASRTKPGHGDERFWDSGMEVKARIDEVKKTWYGEIRIPVSSVDRRPPRAGNELRINLYRQDGRSPERRFLAWQVTGIWNPHRPETFGRLRLVSEKSPPPDRAAGKIFSQLRAPDHLIPSTESGGIREGLEMRP